MMTEQNEKMSKPKNKRGGARPGAGRPKKDRTPTTPTDGQIFETAEAYLAAVVEGTAEADPVRVRAASTLIRYQQTTKRAPKTSPTPKQLEKSERAAEDNVIASDFETKAAEIRRKHEQRLKNDS